MEISHEIYQLVFFSAVFFILRISLTFLLRFYNFKRLDKAGEEDKAKEIIFKLSKEEIYVLAASIGIFFSYLT